MDATTAEYLPINTVLATDGRKNYSHLRYTEAVKFHVCDWLRRTRWLTNRKKIRFELNLNQHFP